MSNLSLSFLSDTFVSMACQHTHRGSSHVCQRHTIFHNNSKVCIIKNQKRIRFIAKQDKIPQTTYWLNVKPWSEARTLSVGRNCPETVICN